MMPSNLHLLSATPLIQFQRTDNANVPGISFLGDGGTEGGSIKFDGTDGTTNEIILSSFHSSAVTERLSVTTTGAKVSGTLDINNNEGTFLFDLPLNSTSPGQACVFYKKDRVLGGGWITEY